MKFYTVPNAQTARKSVVWTMLLIGTFYIVSTILGLGGAVILGPDYILTHGGTNMAGPLLARALGGDILLAIVSAVAFATILAVVAGLTIAASTSLAHDLWANVIRRGTDDASGNPVLVARIAAFLVGFASIVIAILLGPESNAVILASMGMAVAASANFPVLTLSIFWRRFNTTGAIMGLSVGLISSVGLILAGPNFMGIDAPGAATRHLIQAAPLFPLENPGIASVPLGFLAAIVGAWMAKEPTAEAKFNELMVRANTGLAAEKPVAL